MSGCPDIPSHVTSGPSPGLTTPQAVVSDSVPLLGAYAAKQCPVRLFRLYDPTEIAVGARPDDDLQQLFDDGLAFEIQVVAEIVALHDADQVAVIPGRDELDHAARRAMTRAALERRTPIICGALMEPDVDGRRLGEIDVLVATGRTVSGSNAEISAPASWMLPIT